MITETVITLGGSNVFVISDFEVIFQGSDAVERKGVFYAISDLDHPAAKLLQSPQKISRGMATEISLNIRKVRLG
jgi:hypothetical protein